MTLVQFHDRLVKLVRARRLTAVQANRYYTAARKQQAAKAKPKLTINQRVQGAIDSDALPSLAQLQSMGRDVFSKAGIAAAGLGALGIGTGSVGSAAAAVLPALASVLPAIPILGAPAAIIASLVFGKSEAQLLAEAAEAGRVALQNLLPGQYTNVGEVPVFKRGQRGVVGL